MEKKADFEEKSTMRGTEKEDQQTATSPGPTDPKPSDRLRAAFSSALVALKADKVACHEREKDIAVAIGLLNAQKAAYKERKKQVAESLKSSIREILRDEISKRKQSTSVMTAVSALTSLGDSDKCPSQTGSVSDGDKISEDDAGTQSSAPREGINLSFPHKLMEVLSDKANDHIITWLPHGKAFVIYQKEKFTRDILPRYFKETKYTSFTRKLNRWGFERIKKGPEIGAYYHKFFLRENPELCTKMTCVGSKARSLDNDDMSSVKYPEVVAQSSASESDSQHASSSSRILQQLHMFQLQKNPLAPPSEETLRSSFFGQPVTQILPPTNQVDFIAQQVHLMNLHRAHASPAAGVESSMGNFPTQNQMMGNCVNGSSTAVTNNNLGTYSKAVISAAVEALQRSFLLPQSYQQQASPSCSVVFKPMLASPAVLQQHIEQYGRSGVMHPELHATLLQQQAAAESMFRLQQQQRQQPRSWNLQLYVRVPSRT